MSAITEYVRLRPHELTKLRSLLVVGYDSPRLLTVDDVVDYYGHLVWLFHAAATDREPILVWLD